MLDTQEVIKVCSWVTSLVSSVSGKHGKIHFGIGKSQGKDLLPNVNGHIILKDGGTLSFEMILMRKETGILFPYLAMVSHGPMSRTYYPKANTWVKS